VSATAEQPPRTAESEILRLIGGAPLREIPRSRQIFVNRNLKMDAVDVVGFDMDYTLAIYRLRHMEGLAFDMTLQRLIDTLGYPKDLAALTYDDEFVIRGLVLDKEFGNICKMDRFNHVGRCYHGRQLLETSEWKRLYRDSKIRLSTPRFAWIDTLFALPEAALYAEIIETLESRGEKVDYTRLFDDIRKSIDDVHRDGSLKAEIKKDLDAYIVKDSEIGPALHKLRSGGKKLFLLTNSYFDYSDLVMSHLLDGQLPEYPSWRNYFDWVIVGARKPKFFSESNPFLEVEAGTVSDAPAESLERGHVYQGGNLVDFERSLAIGGGRILYVGDHIYGDILRSKKSSLWRTCMVVQELEDELGYTEQCAPAIQRLGELEGLRTRLEDELNQRKLALASLEKQRDRGDLSAEARAEVERLRKSEKSGLEKLRRALRHFSHEIDELEIGIERGINRYWGFLFKEGHENSRFGEQVEVYACLYTSRVSNFLQYSPVQHFRSPRAAMPHERGVLKLAPFGTDRREP